jgi:hypothetical protein
MKMNGQLYPLGKSSRYPLDRKLGGSKSQSGRYLEEGNCFLLPGIEPQPSSPWPVHWAIPAHTWLQDVEWEAINGIIFNMEDLSLNANGEKYIIQV